MSNSSNNPFAEATDPENPYASVTDFDDGDGNSEVERTRNQYLNHEASVQSIGTLYVLGGFLGCLSVLGVGAAAFGGGVGAPEALIALFILALCGCQLATGIGLRQLKPWARIVATILSAIGLLGIPIGTLISIYFLYLLQSKKGAVVFSPEYREVIDATPHIKYRTPVIVWILVLLLLAVIAIGIGGLMFSRV